MSDSTLTLFSQNEHNPDACSKSGFTPLHIAAHYGNVGVARALLGAGADAGRAAKHNITPLHVASKWGQLAMLDLLVENGTTFKTVQRDVCNIIILIKIQINLAGHI